MNPTKRIWNEQDLGELYEQEPKVEMGTTYTTVFLNLNLNQKLDGRDGQKQISIKIPTSPN